jgi:hypothetical protein
MLAAPTDHVNQLACEICRDAGFAEECALPRVAKGGCRAAGLVYAACTTSSVYHTSFASSVLSTVELALH